MNNIYDQHAQAFKGVSAYCITSSAGERVATVAFKYAASGLRTTCYLHILGTPMVRAYASGGGYDKASAAVHKALSRVKADPKESSPFACAFAETLKRVVTDNGQRWDRELRDAGLNVLQAV